MGAAAPPSGSSGIGSKLYGGPVSGDYEGSGSHKVAKYHHYDDVASGGGMAIGMDEYEEEDGRRGLQTCVVIKSQTSAQLEDEKRRGSYKCGRCGVPKKGHICPYQPKLKRRPEEPPPEIRNASTQVEMDEYMILRRLNIEIQGFPESYAAGPDLLANAVGAEAHPVVLVPSAPASATPGRSPSGNGTGTPRRTPARTVVDAGTGGSGPHGDASGVVPQAGNGGGGHGTQGYDDRRGISGDGRRRSSSPGGRTGGPPPAPVQENGEAGGGGRRPPNGEEGWGPEGADGAEAGPTENGQENT